MKKQNLVETKERMLKVFKIGEKIIAIFKWIIIVSLIIGGLSGVCGIILMSNPDTIANNPEISDEIKNMIEESQKSNEALEDNMIQGENLGIMLLKGILIPVVLIAMASIIDNLERIFKTTVQQETPFVEENIKYMRRINIMSLVLFITMNILFVGIGIDIGIFFLVILFAVTYLFKFGYILQQESDETL